MKKVLSVVLALMLVLSLCACGQKEDKKYVIGVCQLVQHDALDKATEGFIAAVKEGLGEENVEIIVKNAGGESSSCTTIANDFISRKVDLIMANATPALQACAAATNEIPILGTAVTHYAPALEIDNWTGTVGGNVSGTSDLASLEKQSKMIKEWFPDTKKVAILYCSSEANSVFQAQEVAGYLKDMGIESKDFTFSDTNDVAAVTQSACGWADVIYVPTDNVAAANAEAIANVVLPSNVPVIACEFGICKGCGVATLTIDYYDLGVATGKMAVEILKDGADVSTMAIRFAEQETALYNENVCKTLGITPLEGYSKIE